jgi:hypothetical protein
VSSLRPHTAECLIPGCLSLLAVLKNQRSPQNPVSLAWLGMGGREREGKMGRPAAGAVHKGRRLAVQGLVLPDSSVWHIPGLRAAASACD